MAEQILSAFFPRLTLLHHISSSARCPAFLLNGAFAAPAGFWHRPSSQRKRAPCDPLAVFLLQPAVKLLYNRSNNKYSYTR